MPPGMSLVQSRLRPYSALDQYRAWTVTSESVIGQLGLIADNHHAAPAVFWNIEYRYTKSLLSVTCCLSLFPVVTCVLTHELSWGASWYPGHWSRSRPRVSWARLDPETLTAEEGFHRSGPSRRSWSNQQQPLGLTSREPARSQLDSDSLSIVTPRPLTPWGTKIENIPPSETIFSPQGSDMKCSLQQVSAPESVRKASMTVEMKR